MNKFPNDYFPEREKLFPLVEAFSDIQQDEATKHSRRLYGRACHDSVLISEAKLVVELGTMFGLSSSAFLRALILNNGKLISFDPNMKLIRYEWMPEGFDDYWTRYEMTGEKGYNRFGSEIKNIDMLYIDTTHSYENTIGLLTNYWVRNIRPGGYITMDDATPHFQAEGNKHNFPGLFSSGLYHYGVLRAVLEFVDKYSDKLEFAYIVDTRDAKGFVIIKFKEGVCF
jgi:hypothetical protein